MLHEEEFVLLHEEWFAREEYELLHECFDIKK